MVVAYMEQLNNRSMIQEHTNAEIKPVIFTFSCTYSSACDKIHVSYFMSL